MKPATKLIIGTLVGIIAFYALLGGFKRISEIKEEKTA